MTTKLMLKKTSTAKVSTKNKVVLKFLTKPAGAKTRKVRTPPKLGKFSRSAIKCAVKAASLKKK